jgi:carboxyl-terminal processing protease
VILLPAEAQTWPAERLCGVLTHELAHVRRWDWLLQVLGQLVRALYWFNPLAWVALGRLRAEQELACDDEVLNAGKRPSDYAAELLALMVNLPPGFLVSSMALALGRVRALERRLRSILDPEHNQRPLTRRGVGLVSLGALCLLVPLTSLQFFHSPVVRADIKTALEPAPDLEDSPLAKVLADVEAKIRAQYITNPKDQALQDGAIRGMVESLKDPFSTYIPKEEADEFRRTMMGEKWTGIGVQLRIGDKGPVVFSPLHGSPALEAGLRPGDLILAVNGKPVQGLSLQEVVRLILGPAGKPVKLKIQPVQGSARDVSITRAEIKVSSLAGVARQPDGHWNFLLDNEHQIGYVRISAFQSATGKELIEVLRKLTEAGMKGLILDLRFCPGGTLDVAVHTAELFLDQGKKIVSLHGREGTKKVFAAKKKGMLVDRPLVVLVNEYTASGAEVVAGALKDNDRALVLGTRTFGKGSVQSLLPLGEGGAQLKLTTAHFQLPSGRSIQKLPQALDWGVDPTDGFYMPMTPKQNQALSQHLAQSEVIGKPDPKKTQETAVDPQRDGALRTLRAKLTRGEYDKVGLPTTAFRAQMAEREKLRAEKEQLQKQLENLNRRLQELEHTGAGKKN